MMKKMMMKEDEDEEGEAEDEDDDDDDDDEEKEEEEDEEKEEEDEERRIRRKKKKKKKKPPPTLPQSLYKQIPHLSVLPLHTVHRGHPEAVGDPGVDSPFQQDLAEVQAQGRREGRGRDAGGVGGSKEV